MQQGTIDDLRPGADGFGFGTIAPDGGGVVYFYADEIDDRAFAELRVGHRVTCEARCTPRDPTDCHAVHFRRQA